MGALIAMIRILARLPNGVFRSDVQPSELAALRADPNVLIWVDLMPQGEEEHAAERLLLEQFAFHPLAIDDALRESHVPKVDDWHEYIYVVLHAVRLDSASKRLQTQELDLFVGKNYLVTHHADAIASLDRIWAGVCREQRRLASGTDNVLYQIIDAIVADYMPLVDQLDDWIDEVESEIFKKPTAQTLARILRQKRRLVSLRRSLSTLREVLNRLARDDYEVIDPQDRVYFRDVYDHVVRLYDIVESMRDLVSGSLDIYLSVTSNRINETMKTLTIVNVIFLPLSFMVGFFGMNFFGEEFALHPHTAGGWLFWLIIALMLVVPPTMYAWMRLRKWV
jgi:magnesium transporter